MNVGFVYSGLLLVALALGIPFALSLMFGALGVVLAILLGGLWLVLLLLGIIALIAGAFMKGHGGRR